MTVSRKGKKSRARVRKLRSTRTKAKERVASAHQSQAAAVKKLDQLKRELKS
jgi:hypothetical protein